MFFTAPLLSFKTIDERTLEKRGEKETSACALQAALQRGVGLFAYFFIKMQGSLAKPKKMWYTERVTAECEIRPCVCRCMVCMVCMRLKNGSCAIRPREPCQVGNQAALSGSSDVPQPACFEYMQLHIFPCGTYGLILCFAVSLCRREPRRCTKRYTGNTALPFFRM